jgi:hypothetical protein
MSSLKTYLGANSQWNSTLGVNCTVAIVAEQICDLETEQ